MYFFVLAGVYGKVRSSRQMHQSQSGISYLYTCIMTGSPLIINHFNQN